MKIVTVFLLMLCANIQINGERLCKMEECEVCDESRAYCQTTEPNNVVPPKLARKIHTIIISYTGNDTYMTADMLHRYYKLRNFTISGNIDAIKPETFVNHTMMYYLTFVGTKVKAFPEGAFDTCRRMQRLLAPYNQLEEIPVVSSWRRLYVIDVSYNNINFCYNGKPKVNPRLKQMHYLRTIYLGGARASSHGCRAEDIDSQFFASLAKIQELNISDTDFFKGDQTILSPLKNLVALIMSDVEPYNSCPAKAATLLKNLPRNLVNIEMQKWRSFDVMNTSCHLTSEMLDGMRSLKRLQRLDMSYSDEIFGQHLSKSIFQGFEALTTLSLSYCRIVSIEVGAFQGVPRLKYLHVEGNPLGARDLWLFGERLPSYQIYSLTMVSTNVVSDETYPYLPFKLLSTAPNLGSLNLKSNFLSVFPVFDGNWTEPHSVSSISKLYIDDNELKQLLFNPLSPGDGCKLFPNLTKVSLSRNRLEDITGLCTTLTELHVNVNNLWVRAKDNFAVIKRMHMLRYLDIKSNYLDELEEDLFWGMADLETLMLSDNKIFKLPDKLFLYTSALEYIDLSQNSLQTVKVSMFSHLQHLRQINLENNRLAVISMDFVSFINSSGISTFKLKGNPFDCDCNQNYFQEWLEETTVIPQVKDLRCSTPQRLVGAHVFNYTTDIFLCNIKEPLIISSASLLGILIALLFGIPCYKYRWYIAHLGIVGRAVIAQLRTLQFECTCEYDAYLSYDAHNEDDCRWVIDHLIPAVEGLGEDSTQSQEDASEDESARLTPTHKTQLSLKLYIEDRDGLTGDRQYSRSASMMSQCRKVIILVSNSYMQSEGCMSEADSAGLEMYGTEFYQPNRILVIVREELTEEVIRAPMTSLLVGNVIHVSQASPRRLKSALKKVVQFLSKPKYYYHKQKRTPPESRDHNTMIQSE